MIQLGLRPLSAAKWEKVPEGRMRAFWRSMHPRGHQFVLLGIPNSGLEALGNRDWRAIGVKQGKELAFGPCLNWLAKHAGGIVGADGFHITQKAVANGLELFGADRDTEFLFHDTRLGKPLKKFKGLCVGVLANGPDLASIEARLDQPVKKPGSFII